MRSGKGVATVRLCFVTPYLTDWLNGSFQVLLAVLMIWGEEICITDLLEFIAKSKIWYKPAISHQPALQNSHFKVPKPPKVW